MEALYCSKLKGGFAYVTYIVCILSYLFLMQKICSSVWFKILIYQNSVMQDFMLVLCLLNAGHLFLYHHAFLLHLCCMHFILILVISLHFHF